MKNDDLQGWTQQLVGDALAVAAVERTSAATGASPEIRRIADTVIGSDRISDPADADLGALDGVNGQLRGDRFDVATVGLRPGAAIDECAALIIGDALNASDRQRLRRHAVVSCLTSVTDHALLRASARWWLAVRAAVDATPEEQRTRFAAIELNEAVTSIFDLGAGPLANKRARVWRHGAATDWDDLLQAARLGMMIALDGYDPNQAPLSSHAHFRMLDQVRDEVWSNEHPHLTRAAFKAKRAILKAAERVENETGLHPHDETLHDLVVARLARRSKPILVNKQAVAQVLMPTSTVSLNVTAGGDDGDEYLDLTADVSAGPVEVVEYLDTLAKVDEIMTKVLNPELRDILQRNHGLGGYEPQDLTTIGQTYDRSRTWAGGQRNRALSIMRHPVLRREIEGAFADPSQLTDGAPILADAKTARLSERQAYVARWLLGHGGPPESGTPQQRIDKVADRMKISSAEVKWIAMTVKMVMTGKIPPTDMLYAPAIKAATGAYQRVRDMADEVRATHAEQHARSDRARAAAAGTTGPAADTARKDAADAANTANIARIAAAACEEAAENLVDIIERLEEWAAGEETAYRHGRARLVFEPVAIMEAAFAAALQAKQASAQTARAAGTDAAAVAAAVEAIQPVDIPEPPKRRRSRRPAAKAKRKKRTVVKTDDKGCSVIEDGAKCTEEHSAMGWCKRHHSRWYRTGTPTGIESERADCTMDGCTGKWAKGGLCNAHWKVAKAQREAARAAKKAAA
jgi:hypothetical protein